MNLLLFLALLSAPGDGSSWVSSDGLVTAMIPQDYVAVEPDAFPKPTIVGMWTSPDGVVTLLIQQTKLPERASPEQLLPALRKHLVETSPEKLMDSRIVRRGPIRFCRFVFAGEDATDGPFTQTQEIAVFGRDLYTAQAYQWGDDAAKSDEVAAFVESFSAAAPEKHDYAAMQGGENGSAAGGTLDPLSRFFRLVSAGVWLFAIVGIVFVVLKLRSDAAKRQERKREADLQSAPANSLPEAAADDPSSAPDKSAESSADA